MTKITARIEKLNPQVEDPDLFYGVGEGELFGIAYSNYLNALQREKSYLFEDGLDSYLKQKEA